MAKKDSLPEEYRPLSMWEYFGYSLLYSVPVVGVVFLIIFALSDKNINRRNYSRSFFVSFILWAIFIGIMIASGTVIGIIQNITQ